MKFFPPLFTVPLFIVIKLANGSKCCQYGTYILQWIALLFVLFCGLTMLGNDNVRYYVIGIQIFDFFTYNALFATLSAILIGHAMEFGSKTLIKS